MAGLSGFASHQCSLHLGLAISSGSSRMSQAPNLHIAIVVNRNLTCCLNVSSSLSRSDASR